MRAPLQLDLFTRPAEKTGLAAVTKEDVREFLENEARIVELNKRFKHREKMRAKDQGLKCQCGRLLTDDNPCPLPIGQPCPEL